MRRTILAWRSQSFTRTIVVSIRSHWIGVVRYRRPSNRSILHSSPILRLSRDWLFIDVQSASLGKLGKSGARQAAVGSAEFRRVVCSAGGATLMLLCAKLRRSGDGFRRVHAPRSTAHLARRWRHAHARSVVRVPDGSVGRSGIRSVARMAHTHGGRTVSLTSGNLVWLSVSVQRVRA